MSEAAAVCESPAASRAARTSSGVGFDEGPRGPRFGWFDISGLDDAHTSGERFGVGVATVGNVPMQGVGRDLRLVHRVALAAGDIAHDEEFGTVGVALASSPAGRGVGGGDGFDVVH